MYKSFIVRQQRLIGLAPVPLCSLLPLSDLAEALEIQQEQAFQGSSHFGASQQGNTIGRLLKPLLHVYEDAQKSFHTLPPRSVDATKAARFLRDTTENLIMYMRSAQPLDKPECLLTSETFPHNANFLVELRETLEWTNEFVERGSGGKKRAWEQSKGQQEQMMRPTQESVINQTTRGGRDNECLVAQKERCDAAPSSSCGFKSFSINSRPRQERVLPRYGSFQRRRCVDPTFACRQIDHHVGRRRSASPLSHRLKGNRTGLPDTYRPKYK